VHDQQFDLSDPIQVIRLYVFCSKLERHLQGTLALELTTWKAPTEMTLQNLMWRSPNQTRKRRRTEAADSGSRSNGGKGVGNDNPPNVGDEFDDEQFTEIRKWRDGVVNNGKEEGSFQVRARFPFEDIGQS